ncbi:PAQR family membrane homeostasis protein TrhA [Streptomyces thermolilacinus]|uniref:PAQR family membrane homeostasis protein TrhA n=1 Tax=Streptomyces thermolilacinus TaxID=285540 RepID=UPI0004248EAF|nr:hemolysin III family protein [Streptomyces thermolilacinus]
MVADDAQKTEAGREVASEDVALAGLPGGSHHGHAGEKPHPVADLVEPVKPKLRGWLHAAMVPASLSAGIVLICLARTQEAALACAVYSVTAWLLFGTSAVYHLGTWGPLGEAVLRRLDHANIFLIIAGTCTPLAVVLLPPDRRNLLLLIVWTGALTGIAFRVLWVNAPRWLYTPCYLVLGWAPVRYLPDFLHTGGAAVVTFIVTGGLLYSAGAVVYAVQRPDPSPQRFGFHEVFHALTVAAFTAHYIAISLTAY